MQSASYLCPTENSTPTRTSFSRRADLRIFYSSHAGRVALRTRDKSDEIRRVFYVRCNGNSSIVQSGNVFNKKSSNQSHFYRKGFVLAGSSGLFNGLYNYLMVILATKLPSVVLYPVVCSGNMILLFLVALLVYHEKFRWYQCVGYTLGLIAIILLNIYPSILYIIIVNRQLLFV